METAVGTLDGITEKASGWFEISVALPGKQYPLRLATKKQELVELARAAGQNVMAWEYNEQESEKINPHNNMPYVNRYFEGVGPVDGNRQDANASPSSVPQAAIDMAANAPVAGRDQAVGGGMSKEEWARKDSAIHKMACIKTAADALKHTLPSDPSAEDLTAFLGRVSTLTLSWHRSVLAERDDPAGENVPFD